jgi:hypothetical protein
MKKTTTTLLLAAALGMASLAQAQTSDVPVQAGEYSTITNGVPNMETSNTPILSGVAVVPHNLTTTVMGAGPAVVYVTPAPIVWTPIVTNIGTHPTEVAHDSDPSGPAANDRAGY